MAISDSIRSFRTSGRDVHSRWWGDRRDLICGPGTAREVYASLLGRQIAVGRTVNGKSEIDEDFEDFGKGLSDEVIARQAFEFFLKLLAEAGYVAPAV